jgi:predicted permease
VLTDIRYAVRGLRRSPTFAASIAATIGLGLGLLCSAVTFLNAYVLKPIDLPNPHALYALTWDTADVSGRSFTVTDFESLRDNAPHFSSLAAVRQTQVMQGDTVMAGGLVTGNYFAMLGATPALGRLLTPADAVAPGDRPVVVLSDHAWRTRYGADTNILGTLIELGRQRFEVVGVTPPRFGLSGEELLGFWAPLTMARAFNVTDPWNPASPPSLFVVGRLRADANEPQARAAFEVWLRQRFPAGTDAVPTAVRVESRATRLPLTGPVLTLVALIVASFGLVLLVACANVTNLLLARALARQREIAVRLSLGAGRWRVARQLAIESLVLAVPASAVGLAITMVSARVIPALMLATWPSGVVQIEQIVMPIDPDFRVLAVLLTAAVVSALLVTLAPAVRAARANLVQASKGDVALDPRRSRLRTGLVATQIGACTLFLVWATGLIEQSRRIANPDTHISHERVVDLRVTAQRRTEIAERLAADPTVERVAAAMKSPLAGPLESIGVVASATRLERNVGFTAVSPEYFPVFDIRIVRGRAFTAEEADQDAPLVVVSEATARLLWPNLDPIGQTLELTPSRVAGSMNMNAPAARRPSHTNVRVIGVAEDVINGMLLDGVDDTCIYFATSLRSPTAQTMLVRARRDPAGVRAAVAAAVRAIEPDATFTIFPLLEMMGAMGWIFRAFSTTASVLGAIGLLLAFSGTYAVVAFLMTQRTRELGIRMALGATVQGIVSRMIGETLRIALVGLGCALVLAALAAGYFSGPLPFIPVFGPRAYLTGTAIVLTATVMAALLPSLRAARIDPSKALRVE